VSGGSPEWLVLAVKVMLAASFVTFLLGFGAYLFVTRKGGGTPETLARHYRKKMIQSAVMLMVTTAATFLVFSGR